MSNPQTRRSFIQNISLTTTGIMLAGLGTQWTSCTGNAKQNEASTPENQAFGIQLWSVKEDMAVDPKAVYASLAAAGYTQIESFEGPKGMFWGMNPTEYKDHLGNLGLTAIASHCNINEEFERKAAEAAEAGLKYLICPHIGANTSLDYYKEAIEKFNTCAEICKSAGLRFAYHNHDYSFRPVEGVLPQQLMLDSTDKDMVYFEMDIYWVAFAEQNPSEWLTSNPGRWPLLHVKDMEQKTEDIGSTQLGTGKLDIEGLIETARSAGTEFLMIEQEKFVDITPMEAAFVNAKFMQNLG